MDTTRSTVVIWVNFFQCELMVEICPKGLVRTISKVLLMKFCQNTNFARIPIKTHKGDVKWPLFVNKQLFWQSASITFGNNYDVLTDV